MAIPSSYSEGDLATYMHTILGNVATLLSFTDPNSYVEPVNSAIAKCGVDAIADITGRTNIEKLRAFARVEAWKLVADNTAGHYSFTADGGTFNRHQVYQQAMENLERAENEARQYDPAYNIGLIRLDYIHDPYVYKEEEDRVE